VDLRLSYGGSIKWDTYTFTEIPILVKGLVSLDKAYCSGLISQCHPD
jgi:hypothetical protein